MKITADASTRGVEIPLNELPVPPDPRKEVSSSGFRRSVPISTGVKSREGLGLGVRFKQAVRHGDEDTVQALLQNRNQNDPSIGSHDMTQALREASAYGYERMVRILLYAGANINIDPIPCQAETHIIEGYSKRVSERVERVDCGFKACGRTALQAAAEGGHAKVVSTLLSAGANANTPASRYYGRTALQAAAAGGYTEIVSTLLGAGADSNAEPSEYYGLTALQAAAVGGHVEILRLLLAAGADTNAKPSPNHGKTALQAAAAAAGGNVASFPSSPSYYGKATADEHISSVSSSSPHEKAPLQATEPDRNVPPFHPHPANKRVFSIPFRSSRSGTILQAAAASRHLLSLPSSPIASSYPADILTPSNREPPSTRAAPVINGHAKVLSILLGAGAEVNARPSPDFGRSALQAAAESGYAEVVQILLDAGANVNAEPSPHHGRTALQAAAGRGHSEVVSILIEAGADVNADPSSTHGRTALQAAAGGGHTKVVLTLLKAGAKIGAQISENGGRTALQAAAEGGHAALVSTLLSRGADISAPASGYNGKTALQAAAGGGYYEIVSALLRAGADVNAEPSASHGRTALQAAAEGGHADVLSILLGARPKINADPSPFHGRTALQAAAGGGHTELVSTLLRAGAYLNAPPGKHSGRTALQAAVEGGHARIVAILLAAGSSIGAPPSEFHGRTAFQAAAECGHVALVRSLLDAGADINIAPGPKHGRTALQAAAGGGHVEIVSILLGAGAPAKDMPSEHGGSTALQAAAGSGHIEVVSALLAAGADVNAAPSQWQGRTALQAAAEGGHAAIVSMLLEREASVNAPPAKNSGRTALQAVAGGGHAEIYSILHDAGAEIEAQPSEHNGRTALQAAAEGGHAHIVKRLLDAGVEVDSMDSDGATCLKWANSYPQLVKLLLSRGASLTVQDKTGATPLHWAVLGDSARSLRLLIEAGADTESQDYEDRRPLDILLDRGENAPIKLIRPLLKNGSSIQGRVLNDWRKVLNPKNQDIIRITRELVDGKCSTDIDLVRPEPLGGLKININPLAKTLYSAAKVPFPVSPKEPENEISSIVQWFWTLEQQARYAGMPIRPPIHGTGLPSHIGKSAATTDTQVLLTCYVSFVFLVHNPATGPKKAFSGHKSSAGKPFYTRSQKTEISWTLRRAPSKLSVGVHPEVPDDGEKTPIFRSTDYRSTLDIGWIPNHGIDFFSLFILDLQKKWRDLLEKADDHLSSNRMSILENRGRTADFIDNLLLDEKQWMRFRTLLQGHVREAKGLLKVFKDNRYLSEETTHYEKVEIGRRMSFESKAITKLSKIIEEFEIEIGGVINQLDLKKQEMIHLEFNLVSIYEARTSKKMGLSMKRLSWITFVFLPLMFVAALFGMNVDLLSNDPHWMWVVVIAGGVFTVVILGWALLKVFVYFRVEHWLSKKWKGQIRNDEYGDWKPEHMSDLELGQPKMDEDFGSWLLRRQWTKLKGA